MRGIFFFLSFFSNKQTKFFKRNVAWTRSFSLSRVSKSRSIQRRRRKYTSQGRRGRSRQSRLCDFCSSTVLVLSRSFSRGRGRGREQIRGKMIIDAVNGPQHHRHSNKIYILLFPQTRARDSRVISRVFVPRANKCALWIALRCET